MTDRGIVRGAVLAPLALLVLPLLGACGSATEQAAEAPPSPTATSAPTSEGSATATPEEPTAREEMSRGGARAPVSDTEIMLQLARVAERIASRVPRTPPAPEDVDPASNRGLGYRLLIEFGFPADQWPYLDLLWQRESGWNHFADNPTSSAYGIPQSLPGEKMAVVGDDWRTNPETQIRWGLAYIAARYGDPEAAWAHSERVGWY